MALLPLLIHSTRQDVIALLRGRLPPDVFQIHESNSDVALAEQLHRLEPAIVVVDVDVDRPGKATLAVALVKSSCPGSKVIVLSRHSSPADGDLVEQGVFLYLCGSPTETLARAVKAAAGRCTRSHGFRG